MSRLIETFSFFLEASFSASFQVGQVKLLSPHSILVASRYDSSGFDLSVIIACHTYVALHPDTYIRTHM